MGGIDGTVLPEGGESKAMGSIETASVHDDKNIW